MAKYIGGVKVAPTEGVYLYSDATHDFEDGALTQKATKEYVQTQITTANSLLKNVYSVIKASDTTRDTTTTQTADDELTIADVPVGKYALDILILSNSGATPDFKWELVCAGTATGYVSIQGLGGAPVALDADLTIAGTGAIDANSYTGYIDVTVAGDVTINWAQATSNGGDTILVTGSYLRLIQI